MAGQSSPEGLSLFNWNRWSIHGLDPEGKELILDPIRELFPASKQPVAKR